MIINCTIHKTVDYENTPIDKVEDVKYIWCCDKLKESKEVYMTPFQFNSNGGNSGMRLYIFWPNSDGPDYEFEQKINFCPFCGEKITCVPTKILKDKIELVEEEVIEHKMEMIPVKTVRKVMIPVVTGTVEVPL